MKSLKTCNFLKELRAFCITVHEGNMSKAAEVLLTSQPTISQQIKKLETELETRLFERRGPNLKITTEGEILHRISSPLIQRIDSIKEEFSTQQGNLVSGELRIAAEESTILYTLAEPIKRFTEKYPGIRLKLSNVTGLHGREQVLADDVDFAVSSMLDTPKDIEYKPFVSYPMVLITPLDHPLSQKDITIKDIAEYKLILPPPEFSSWKLIKMIFSLHGLDFNLALEAGGWEVVKKYVSISLGVSIVTSICINEDDSQKLSIIPIDKIFPDRKYGVVTRKLKVISSPAKCFIDMLHDFYSEPYSNI